MSRSVIINELTLLEEEPSDDDKDNAHYFQVVDGVSGNAAISMSIASGYPVHCVTRIDAFHESFLANMTLALRTEEEKKCEKPWVIINLSGFPYIGTKVDTRDPLQMYADETKDDDFSRAIKKYHKDEYNSKFVPVIVVNTHVPFSTFTKVLRMDPVVDSTQTQKEPQKGPD